MTNIQIEYLWYRDRPIDRAACDIARWKVLCVCNNAFTCLNQCALLKRFIQSQDKQLINFQVLFTIP